MTQKEFIDKTIEVLETDGWCRNDRTDEKGRHCVLGAFDMVSNGAVRYAVSSKLRKLVKNPVLWYWNDSLPLKSGKRTVIRTLKRLRNSL